MNPFYLFLEWESAIECAYRLINKELRIRKLLYYAWIKSIDDIDILNNFIVVH